MISLVTARGYRPIVIAGNAKNAQSTAEALVTAAQLQSCSVPEGMRVLYAPGPAHYALIHDRWHDRSTPDRMILGAQRVAYEPSERLLGGSVTGIFSANNLDEHGGFSLVWHSDQRHYEEMPIRWASAVANGLMDRDITPVLCCGEKMNEPVDDVLQTQLQSFVMDIGAERLPHVILAYEPVAHIKTEYNKRQFGEANIKPLAVEDALWRCRRIREIIAARVGDNLAQQMVILYGGSCDADILPQLLKADSPAERIIDGGLIATAFVKGPRALLDAARPFAEMN